MLCWFMRELRNRQWTDPRALTSAWSGRGTLQSCSDLALWKKKNHNTQWTKESRFNKTLVMTVKSQIVQKSYNMRREKLLRNTSGFTPPSRGGGAWKEKKKKVKKHKHAWTHLDDKAEATLHNNKVYSFTHNSFHNLCV